MEDKSGRQNSLGISKVTALKFVVLLGVVSLFADMTYEGLAASPGHTWPCSEKVEQ